jgi:hypothetical protein
VPVRVEVALAGDTASPSVDTTSSDSSSVAAYAGVDALGIPHYASVVNDGLRVDGING